MRATSRFPSSSLLVVATAVALAACVDNTPGPNPPPPILPEEQVPPVPGQTDFTTTEQGAFIGAGGSSGAADAGAAAPGSGAAGTGGSSGANAGPAAPGGRVAEVEEADTYRLSGNNLFYLNTYRGFLVYDISDPKKPVAVSRLPVYGYPIEMFVDGNVVYALLRDALYLTTIDGKLQFQRHNVSQLVTIDVSNPAAPRVLKTLDIIGQLREGVSRKVDRTIYVVSQQFGGYSWGWPTIDVNPREQAWVYSYDISDPASPRQAGQLQIFEGGNRLWENGVAPQSYRYFSGAAISATANALMVTENWWTSGNGNGPCGWQSSQEAVVSIIDISDPSGAIRRHTRFETKGILNDQFKMTYRSDDVTGKGTFFGIFARQDWGGCSGQVETQNLLESWDVSDGANPKRLAQLQFGKPGETVQASSYDLSRNVVYAITARRIDPLYAIDITDAAAPRVLSAIDGLSGSVSVFRQVAGGQFLLGVGQDMSDSCAGIQDGDPSWQNTRMAVTIVDVRQLNDIKLVQRKCVTIKNAGWSWSSINWNLDQAHKMLGMFQDGDLNILTVPVSYQVKEELAQGGQGFGWWHHYQTAVGLLTWDLTRYDPTKPAPQQTVVQGYGTFLHPEGEVSRSILFKHPVTGERSMINVSDTHLSVANIQNLDQPRLESIIEVAPSVSELYAFGGHVVERVESGRWSPQGMSEFRVKLAGAGVSAREPVATFRVGQATATYRYKDNLLVLRNADNSQEVLVFGLADPTKPRLLSRIAVPLQVYQYYGFYCGMGWGYWFGQGEQTVVTDHGLAWLRHEWQPSAQTSTRKLAMLDLRDPVRPSVHERTLPAEPDHYWISLVRDPSSGGFYLNHRQASGVSQHPSGASFTSFRYYAQRWELGAGGLVSGVNINLPGTLARTWMQGDRRMFLTHDNVHHLVEQSGSSVWRSDTRLNLLRQLGTNLAELLDARTFPEMYLGALVVGDGKLFASASKQWWGWNRQPGSPAPSWEETSDRLLVLDLSASKLTSLYDQPLRTYGAQLMGYSAGNLFLNVSGDGVLLTDVSNPSNPRGRRFLRTLGWGSHIEVSDSHAYVASGNFGVFELDLTAPADFTPN